MSKHPEIAAEIERLKVKVTQLEADLEAAYIQCDKSASEARCESHKNTRLHNLLDEVKRTLGRRTTALCALLELADPTWTSPKEEAVKSP